MCSCKSFSKIVILFIKRLFPVLFDVFLIKKICESQMSFAYLKDFEQLFKNFLFRNLNSFLILLLYIPHECSQTKHWCLFVDCFNFFEQIGHFLVFYYGYYGSSH